MSENILKIDSLRYSVDNNIILDNINFSVQPGEYISIIGPNGAGKSTLLKILCRLNSGKIKGTVLLKNKNIGNYTRKHISEIIAYIPQFTEHKNFGGYTVFEYILTGRFHYISRLNGYTKKDVETAYTILEELKISKFKNRMLSTLSGGELQKVILGAALAQETEIIMLDESSNFLDLHYKLEFNERIKKFAESGKTIISITHNINDAINSSAKILVLKESSQYYFGEPYNFFDSSLAEKVFNVKFKKISVDNNNIYYLPATTNNE